MGAIKKHFSQVCVWPGCLVKNAKKGGRSFTEEEFEAFMKTAFGVRVKYLEEIKTLPDMKDGVSVKGTGKRNDLFFAVHDADVMVFSVARMQVGIRWIEDVLSVANYRDRIYPERVFEYCSWDDDEMLAKIV